MKPCDHPCYMLRLQHFKENMRQKIQASILKRKNEIENSSFHFSLTYLVLFYSRPERRKEGAVMYILQFPYFQAPLLKFFIDTK